MRSLKALYWDVVAAFAWDCGVEWDDLQEARDYLTTGDREKLLLVHSKINLEALDKVPVQNAE